MPRQRRVWGILEADKASKLSQVSALVSGSKIVHDIVRNRTTTAAEHGFTCAEDYGAPRHDHRADHPISCVRESQLNRWFRGGAATGPKRPGMHRSLHRIPFGDPS
jgi:hypothetical protein